MRAASTSSGLTATGCPSARVGGRERRRPLRLLAAHRLRHRVGHPEQVSLGRAVDVPVVGGFALHHAHAGTALTAALGSLDATVVEREREALARLGVQLGKVASARERALEHARGKLRLDERHDLA